MKKITHENRLNHTRIIVKCDMKSIVSKELMIRISLTIKRFGITVMNIRK
jgi:hypothetical protein